MAVTPHYLAGEMAFAKVVETAEGDALMVAGRVYHVRGPSGNESEVFAQALRKLAQGDTPMMAASPMGMSAGSFGKADTN